MSRWQRLIAGAVLALAPVMGGCGTVLPPLRGQLEVGHDAYGVFIGGDGGSGDLYAFEPNGGTVFQLTYTPVAELAPALSPDGVYVALLRAASLTDSTPGTAWVINLRNGDDRELELPHDAGAPRRAGWARDTSTIYVNADSGVYRFDAPFGRAKGRRVVATDRANVDSAFAVLLGEPAFARVVRCDDGRDLCVASDSGAPDLLAHGARDPMRWGSDSVGYFLGDVLEVRPLGPGRRRLIRLQNAPPHPHSMTFFSGRPDTREGTPTAANPT